MYQRLDDAAVVAPQIFHTRVPAPL
jgi:hypothetical protein